MHTTQNQLVFGRDVVFGHEREHWVARGQLEGRGHLALLRTLAHQRDVAARAERKGEGIEQDGLAGAGLPREHGQTGGELDIESIDEDNVANREPGQHDTVLAFRWAADAEAYGLPVAARPQGKDGTCVRALHRYRSGTRARPELRAAGAASWVEPTCSVKPGHGDMGKATSTR